MTAKKTGGHFMTVNNNELHPGDVMLEPLACGYVTAPPAAIDAYGEHVFITLDHGQPYPDAARDQVRIYRPGNDTDCLHGPCKAAGPNRPHDVTCPRLHELIEIAALLWPDLGRD
ncbi:hypothetical protein ACFV1N_48005 [Streptosporangium canum]|uniref:hypothetical protein n=1 Tax=Streptosporangium canum TaxID=324952 RepID=UPI003698926F